MLTQQRLKELLHYDPLTGVFTWKTSRQGHTCAGDVAGYVRPDGYRLIKTSRVTYRAHRLAWLYVNGVFPPDEIDHINLVRGGNRIANLRVASSTQNKGNKRRLVTNSSGYKGAYWSKRDHNWYSVIQFRRRSMRLGSYQTALEAHKAYVAAAVKYFGVFARAA